jgi:hypothetical protein
MAMQITRRCLLNGSGDVLLQTLGPNGDVLINSAIQSVTGNITINSSDDIVVNGIVTTGGAGTIYLVASNGATDAVGSLVDGITLNSNISSNSGDILINSQRDVQQSALINSVSGDIGIIAGRDVQQMAAGDITTTSGDLLISSGRDWMMNADTVISAGGGQMLGRATGQIALGRISLTNASSNAVAIDAGSDLSDANGVMVNIEETGSAANTSVSLRSGGKIGNSDLSSLSPGANVNAIDLNVDVVSATAVAGIYLQEIAAGGALTISHVSAVTVSIDNVQQSRFNSTSINAGQNRTIASLEDLATSSNGPIKVVAASGTITLNGGSDLAGLSANGTGDILLEARGANSDVVVNANITSGSGHITLDAADDVDLNAALNTGGAGTVYITGAGVSLDAAVNSVDGDVLIFSTQEITQTAVINSTDGDVGLVATTSITQTVNGDITTTTGDVFIDAGSQWTMNADSTITAGGGDVLGASRIKHIPWSHQRHQCQHQSSGIAGRYWQHH